MLLIHRRTMPSVLLGDGSVNLSFRRLNRATSLARGGHRVDEIGVLAGAAEGTPIAAVNQDLAGRVVDDEAGIEAGPAQALGVDDQPTVIRSPSRAARNSNANPFDSRMRA